MWGLGNQQQQQWGQQVQQQQSNQWGQVALQTQANMGQQQQQWGQQNQQQQWGQQNQQQQWGQQQAQQQGQQQGKGNGKGKGKNQWQQQKKADEVTARWGVSPMQAIGKAPMATGLQMQMGQANVSTGTTITGTQGTQVQVKLAKTQAEIAGLETLATSVLEKAKTVIEDANVTPQLLKTTQDSLEKQQTRLGELQKTLTTDLGDARRAGATAGDAVSQLTKLGNTTRTLWSSITRQINILKPKTAKLQAEQEMKAKEAKDTAAFKALFIKAKTDVASAENAVNSVSKQANPVITNPPAEGEARDKKVEAITKAAEEATKKVDTAREVLAEKMKTVLTYAPEAKKTAQTELLALQKKITDAQKALVVYKMFKVQLPKLAESHKSLSEVATKLAGHDSPITKATDLAKPATLTKTKLEAINKLLEPVQTGLKEAMQLLTTKFKGVDAVTTEKVGKHREKHGELQKKVAEVMAKIKGQKDAFDSEAAIDAAKEHAEKAESLWQECCEAEMPFLTGVEVLAGEKHQNALKQCADALESCAAKAAEGKKHVTLKIAAAKSYDKDLSKSTVDELTPLLKKIQEIDTKLAKYRKELNERKTASVLAEASEASEEFLKVAESTESSTEALDVEELDGQSVEKIQEKIEKAKTAIQDADKKRSAAVSLKAQKMKELKGINNHPMAVQIEKDIQKGTAAVSKVKSSIAKAEKLVKAIIALKEGETKVKDAEAEVEKVEKLVPKEGKPYDSEIDTNIKQSCAAAAKVVAQATNFLQPHVGGAPEKTKEALNELLQRAKAATAKLTEVKASIRDRSEGIQLKQFLDEAEEKVKAAEAAAEKMDEAEKPFNTGKDLELQATQDAIKKCQEAAREAGKLLEVAKVFIVQKKNVAKAFKEEAATALKEGLESKMERITTNTAKKTKLEKDTKDRTKELRMVEVNKKAEEVEAAVERFNKAAEPFTKDGAEDMSEAAAEKPLKAFAEASEDVQKKIAVLSALVAERRKEQQGENVEKLKGMQENITKFKADIAIKKKATVIHEKKAIAKKLPEECKEIVSGLKTHVENAQKAAAQLLEEGGEAFLVDSSIQTLAAMCQKYMQEDDQTLDELFSTIKKGKAANEKEFITWLTRLPRTIGQEDLSEIKDERRGNIFKKIASSASKGVTKEDFEAIFKEDLPCTKATTVTDKYEVEGSETLCKVEVGNRVEIFGRHKTDAAGLTRSQCKVGDVTGWITIKQDKGAKNLGAPASAWKTFCTGMDKQVQEANIAVTNAAQALAGKLKQGGEAKEGPLKEARDKCTKQKDEATEAQKAMADIKKKAADAKRALDAKIAAEKTAHITARNEKEAAPFLVGPKSKIEALEKAAKAAEDAAAPMATLSGEEAKTFKIPTGFVKKVDDAVKSLTEKAEAAREAIKEQKKAAGEVTPKTAGVAEALKQLGALVSKVEQVSSGGKKPAMAALGKARLQANAKADGVAEAIRTDLLKKKKTAEAFFDSLKKGDKITEDAFVKFAEKLQVDGSALGGELARLVCQKIEADGVSKDKFIRFVCVFYRVVKDIAFTDALDIEKCKTIRKAALGEIIEVLEGPSATNDGVKRLRAKTTKKDDKTEGWITLSSNTGTPYLVKAQKPVEKA